MCFERVICAIALWIRNKWIRDEGVGISLILTFQLPSVAVLEHTMSSNHSVHFCLSWRHSIYPFLRPTPPPPFPPPSFTHNGSSSRSPSVSSPFFFVFSPSIHTVITSNKHSLYLTILSLYSIPFNSRYSNDPTDWIPLPVLPLVSIRECASSYLEEFVVLPIVPTINSLHLLIIMKQRRKTHDKDRKE